MQNGQQNFRTTIAKNVKVLRKGRHLTQVKLANELYCDERTVRRLESEGTSDLDTIEMIAHSFDVDAKDIIFGDLSEFHSQSCAY